MMTKVSGRMHFVLSHLVRRSERYGSPSRLKSRLFSLASREIRASARVLLSEQALPTTSRRSSFFHGGSLPGGHTDL